MNGASASRRLVAGAAFLITTVCVLWAIEAHRWIEFTFFPQSVLALVLGLAVFVAFLTLRVDRTARGPVPWYDWIAAVVGLATFVFVCLDYERLSMEYGNRS